MIQIPSDCTDVRVEFAQRFDSIARARGIEPNALLQRESVDHSVFTLAANTKHSSGTSSRCTLVVPGLLGSSIRSLIAPLLCARERLAVKGYDIDVAWVSGRSGCDRNAKVLRRHVLEAANRTGHAVNVVGYSKGCADALHMLGNYTDTHLAVHSLTSYAGVVRGAYLATGVSKFMDKFLQYVPLPGEAFGDGRAITDLTITRRQEWLLNNTLPKHIRLYSIAAAPPPELISRMLKTMYWQLAEINPKNDSQVIYADTFLPRSEILAVVNADHWAIALPIAERHQYIAKLLIDKNHFPRDVLLQALIDHIECAGSIANEAIEC